MAFYTHTIAAIREKLQERHPRSKAPDYGQPSLSDLPGYVHWMLNGIERMNQSTTAKALQAARWLGWTLRVVEEDLKFWDNRQSRRILGRDISENEDIPKHINRDSKVEIHDGLYCFKLNLETIARQLYASCPDKFDNPTLLETMIGLISFSEVWKNEQNRDGIKANIRNTVNRVVKPKFDPSKTTIHVPGIGTKKISDLSTEDKLMLSDYLNSTRL